MAHKSATWYNELPRNQAQPALRDVSAPLLAAMPFGSSPDLELPGVQHHEDQLQITASSHEWVASFATTNSFGLCQTWLVAHVVFVRAISGVNIEARIRCKAKTAVAAGAARAILNLLNIHFQCSCVFWCCLGWNSGANKYPNLTCHFNNINICNASHTLKCLF